MIKVAPKALGGVQGTLLCALVERDNSGEITETNFSSIVVEPPFIAEECGSRSMDNGIDGAKPTDTDPRGRVSLSMSLQHSTLV
jgi:hypothetical protein